MIQSKTGCGLLACFLIWSVAVSAAPSDSHPVDIKVRETTQRLESRSDWRKQEAARLGIILPGDNPDPEAIWPTRPGKPLTGMGITPPPADAPSPVPPPAPVVHTELEEAVVAEEPARPKRFPIPWHLDFWKKERERLEARGHEFSFDYTGEYIRALENHDGNNKTVYLDNLSLGWSVDLAKVGAGPDGTFYLSLLGNSGGNITGEHLDASHIGRIGDLQILSNIETNESFRLYECWWEKPVGRADILFGLHDMNADFYNTEYGGLFSNSSFGMGPDIALNAPLSVFNVTAPAIRVKYRLSPRLTLLGGIYDGYPGSNAENRHGFGLRISHSEGFLHAFELQSQNPFGNPRLPGLLKIGRWHHTGRFEDLMNTDLAGNPLLRRHNWGTYGVLDQRVWQSRTNENRGIGVFAQAGGGTPQDRSLVEQYVGIGLNLLGTFAGRDQDIFGVAFGRAKTSSALKRFSEALGETGLGSENALEIDYQAKVTDYLSIKPVYQIIRNVGGDATRGDSRVLSVRGDVAF